MSFEPCATLSALRCFGGSFPGWRTTAWPRRLPWASLYGPRWGQVVALLACQAVLPDDRYPALPTTPRAPTVLQQTQRRRKPPSGAKRLASPGPSTQRNPPRCSILVLTFAARYIYLCSCIRGNARSLAIPFSSIPLSNTLGSHHAPLSCPSCISCVPFLQTRSPDHDRRKKAVVALIRLRCHRQSQPAKLPLAAQRPTP